MMWEQGLPYAPRHFKIFLVSQKKASTASPIFCSLFLASDHLARSSYFGDGQMFLSSFFLNLFFSSFSHSNSPVSHLFLKTPVGGYPDQAMPPPWGFKSNISLLIYGIDGDFIFFFNPWGRFIPHTKPWSPHPLHGIHQEILPGAAASST